MRLSEHQKELQKGADFRKANGITKCFICKDCDKLFAHPGRVGHSNYCDDCKLIMMKLHTAIYFTRIGMMKLGFTDGRALKELREEMIAEEGPEFTDFVMGTTCEFVRRKKHEMEADSQ